MQTPPISSRNGSQAMPPTRKLKPPGSTATSLNPAAKTPKVVVDRRSPANEKKRPSSKVSELEEELKKAREQLSSSERGKRRAQQEAEEAKKQLATLSAKLDESQKQLNELYECEESRVRELRKISQERDKAWQSELEAVQRHYSMDSASAMNEIQKLKLQLDRVSLSEESLRIELTKTLDLVERLKEQLNDCRDNEARAVEQVSEIKMKLQAVENDRRDLQLECDSVKESFNSLIVEMEHSKSRVNSLEEAVERLQRARDESLEESGALEELQSSLLEKESMFLSIKDENEKLIREIMQGKTERSRANDEGDELAGSCMRVERVTEQLDAAQASNAELEDELRRVKVQCDQWRKAAEAAAAALVSNFEKTGSLDFCTGAERLSSSPHSDDSDDDSPKKKNGNMLKRIGVLLKKGPK